MDSSDLLPDLIQIQEEEGYLKEEKIIALASKKKIPLAKIHEVATFYSFLTTKKPGNTIIYICNSPSCYLNKSNNIISIFQKLLGISLGETTKDGKFTLKTTSCIGCCDHPPAALIEKELYTNLTEKKIQEILEKCK